jgi:anaerobic magnesium-protoporphyrin IX monomethyl ester cyclase
MKILLVRPVTNKMPIIIPNLGLAYLARQLENHAHEVDILDCAKLNYTHDNFKDYLAVNKFDMIGVQIFTCDFTSAWKMIDIVKESNNNIITIAGGPHISGVPEYTMNTIKNLDYGFCSEAEIGIVKFCDFISGKIGFDISEIPGLIYRENGEVKINKNQVFENLDLIDFPQWDLINPNTYPHAPHGTFTKSLPIAPVITSRGCPYSCKYCGVKTNTGIRFRKRSPENIISEIELLKNKYGIREIHIEDDNFTFDRERVIKFCNTLLDKKLDIYWACPDGVRLDTLDKELLQLMEKSGCYSFAVGLESGSPKILKDMNRKITIETMIEKVNLIASETKIEMTGFMMAGYPTESVEDIEKTIKLALSLPLSKVQFSNFVPLPGTKIFDELIEKKEISLDTFPWDSVQDNRIIYSPPGILPNQLHQIIKKGFFKFYFRPSIMLRLLKEIHSFSQFKIVLQRVVDIFQNRKNKTN